MDVDEQRHITARAERDLPDDAPQPPARLLLDGVLEEHGRRRILGARAPDQRFVGDGLASHHVHDRLEDHLDVGAAQLLDALVRHLDRRHPGGRPVEHLSRHGTSPTSNSRLVPPLKQAGGQTDRQDARSASVTLLAGGSPRSRSTVRARARVRRGRPPRRATPPRRTGRWSRRRTGRRSCAPR